MKKNLYNDQLILKISEELKEKAQEKAAENEQTLSGYIRELILKDIRGV
jgi:predicted HicB family RNase H-like nuclease